MKKKTDKEDINEYVRKLQDMKDKGENSQFYIDEKDGNMLIKEKSFLEKLILWIQPELKEMFPEPGSFSGLMLLWPPLWWKILKLKSRKNK